LRRRLVAEQRRIVPGAIEISGPGLFVLHFRLILRLIFRLISSNFSARRCRLAGPDTSFTIFIGARKNICFKIWEIFYHWFKG
jgi:hypothetical protein